MWKTIHDASLIATFSSTYIPHTTHTHVHALTHIKATTKNLKPNSNLNLHPLFKTWTVVPQVPIDSIAGWAASSATRFPFNNWVD